MSSGQTFEQWSKLKKLDYKEAKINLLEEIKKSEDYKWLATLIAIEQSDYWYDPCGKSGNTLDAYMSEVTRASVRRIHELMGMGRLS